MPQKPLKASGGRVNKPGKKQQAANRHGKSPILRKGRLAIAPRDARLLAQYKDARELTKAINHKNEQGFAAKATSGGGRLAVLKKAAPPIMQSKDKKHRASAAAAVAKAKEDAAAERAAGTSSDGGDDPNKGAMDHCD